MTPHVLERPASNSSRGELREEALDLVEPTSTGRREVHVIAGESREPARSLRRLVRAVVVHDDVDIAPSRRLGIEAQQEPQELLVPLAPMAPADHLAQGDIERGKVRRRTGCSRSFAAPESRAHRQLPAQPVQCLHQTLFDTHDQSMVQGIETKADDIMDHLDKLRIGRQLKRVRPMRLQPERLRSPGNRRLRQARHVGHAPRGPLGGRLPPFIRFTLRVPDVS